MRRSQIKDEKRRKTSMPDISVISQTERSTKVNIDINEETQHKPSTGLWEERRNMISIY